MANEADDNGFDLALEKVLRAAGTSLRHYTPTTKAAMRAAMREVMMKAYTDGSNACHAAYVDAYGHAPSNTKAKPRADGASA